MLETTKIPTNMTIIKTLSLELGLSSSLLFLSGTGCDPNLKLEMYVLSVWLSTQPTSIKTHPFDLTEIPFILILFNTKSIESC